MKTITLNSPDGKAKFTIGAYKAGETFEAFKGATGIFGAKAGSKTAGLIYIVENSGTVHASDMDVDNETQWDWIGEWMQKGMNAEDNIKAMKTALEFVLGQLQPEGIRPGEQVKLYSDCLHPTDDEKTIVDLIKQALTLPVS